MKEKEASFLGDWSTLFETGFDDSSMSVAPTTIASSLQGKNLTSQEIAEEIKVVGSTTLKPNKTERAERNRRFKRNDRFGLLQSKSDLQPAQHLIVSA